MRVTARHDEGHRFTRSILAAALSAAALLCGVSALAQAAGDPLAGNWTSHAGGYTDEVEITRTSSGGYAIRMGPKGRLLVMDDVRYDAGSRTLEFRRTSTNQLFRGVLSEGKITGEYWFANNRKSAAPWSLVKAGTATPTRFTVQAGDARVAPGASIRVPVSLLKASNVANLNFEVRYDSSVVVFDGEAVKGDLLGGAFLAVNGKDSGLVRGAFAVSSGISGTGVIATLPFRAVGAPGRKTVLTVSVTAANGPSGAAIPTDRINGSIEIVGVPVTPVPPPPTVVPPPPPPTIPAGGSGDCNGDGRVTEVDALCALRISVGLQASNPLMDVNGDGSVTSLDAAKILRKAVGKE